MKGLDINTTITRMRALSGSMKGACDALLMQPDNNDAMQILQMVVDDHASMHTEMIRLFNQLGVEWRVGLVSIEVTP